MSGPWEKYQKQPTEGPWTKYQEKPVESPVQEKGLIRRGAEAVIDSPALPIAGGIAGAIAGVGAASVPLAALGGAAGESFRQIGARSLGMEAPQTSADAAKKIGIEAATQAAGEVGGKAIAVGARAIAPAAKKLGGDLFQIVTKMKPQDAATLFKNPKAILPSEWTKAQAAWRKAAEGIGLPVDDISPEMIDILQGDGRKIVFETYAKLQKGQAVTAKEAQIAKQALDSVVMPVAKTVRKNPQVATLNMIRDRFQEHIGKEAPAMKAANKQYAIAAVGKKFRSPFPRNTTGDPAYFRSTVLPSIIFGSGYASGDPMSGALAGLAGGVGTSPLAIGSVLALLGAGRGFARPAGKATTSALAELLSQNFER